jgi:hypothetical protein
MIDAYSRATELPNFVRARLVDDPRFALIATASLGILALAAAQSDCSPSGGQTVVVIAAGMGAASLVLRPSRSDASRTRGTAYFLGIVAALLSAAVRWFLIKNNVLGVSGSEVLHCGYVPTAPIALLMQFMLTACFAVPVVAVRRTSGFAGVIAADRAAVALGLWLMLAGIAGSVNAKMNVPGPSVCGAAELPFPKAMTYSPPPPFARTPLEIVGGCVAVLGLGALLRAAWRIRARGQWFDDVQAQRVHGWRLDPVTSDIEEIATPVAYRLICENTAQDYRELAMRPTLVLTLPIEKGGPKETAAIMSDVTAMVLSIGISVPLWFIGAGLSGAW